MGEQSGCMAEQFGRIAEQFGRIAEQCSEAKRPGKRSETTRQTKRNDQANEVCDQSLLFHDKNQGFYPGFYLMPYFFLNLSTRPPVSTSFCLPVKKG